MSYYSETSTDKNFGKVLKYPLYGLVLRMQILI